MRDDGKAHMPVPPAIVNGKKNLIGACVPHVARGHRFEARAFVRLRRTAFHHLVYHARITNDITAFEADAGKASFLIVDIVLTEGEMYPIGASGAMFAP